MTTVRRRNAFTLIELLTVIAIITLLIGILTPSLGRARDEAKKVAIKTQLYNIGVGLEQFQNDQGKYASSNAGEYSNFDTTHDFEVGTAGAPLQGANLIVDAMIGRDFLGYDPNPTQTSGTPTYNRWFDQNQRRAKYVDPAGISASKNTEAVKDSFGAYGNAPAAANDPATPTIDNLYCPVFVDKFGWPILYYRANPSATQRNWMLPDGWTASNNTAKNNSVYNGLDNRNFTDHQLSNQPGQHHEIDKASAALNAANEYAPTNNFSDFIRSFRSSTRDTSGNVTFLRPVNADRFILLSPGKDGIWGNLDDVANFEVKSEER